MQAGTPTYRHSALVQFKIEATSPRPATGSARYSRPSMTHSTPIRASSSASSVMPAPSRRWTPRLQSTSTRAGIFSIPLHAHHPRSAFGALVAAGIPLLLALTAVFATFGLVPLPSRLLPIDSAAYAVVLLVGLAVGVDYTMFYLRREREERAAGRSPQACSRGPGGGNVRTVSPDLRPDGDGRDGGNVPDRRVPPDFAIGSDWPP